MKTETVSVINKEIEEFLHERGAIKVGFATLETLKSEMPSTDITYLLPEARSAISFALAENREQFRDFLAKKDQQKCDISNRKLMTKSDEIATELAGWLEKKGFKSKSTSNNEIYRDDIPRWRELMVPDISHRYIAVASGVGSFGWSGNLLVEGHGSAVLLNTVVTSAELAPTSRIPEGEGYCVMCKLCVAACPSKFTDANEKTTIIIGAEEFTYGKKNDKNRCNYVCGGFSGLHRSKKWSTWSPGRLPMPEKDEKFQKLIFKAVMNYVKWPKRRENGVEVASGNYNPLIPDIKIYQTCGNCQKICAGSKEENRKNYDLLVNSGCVIQKPDGDIIVLPSDKAQEMFDGFPVKHQKKYGKKKSETS